MKSIRQILQQIRRETRPVYQQMELPLAGIRLAPEQSRMVRQLREIREALAAV